MNRALRTTRRVSLLASGAAVPPQQPASKWACHLMAPVLAQQPALASAEADRLQHLHDRLLAALYARDRAGVRAARQAVLRASLTQRGSMALRGRLRDLAWRSAALLPRLI